MVETSIGDVRMETAATFAATVCSFRYKGGHEFIQLV